MGDFASGQSFGWTLAAVALAGGRVSAAEALATSATDDTIINQRILEPLVRIFVLSHSISANLNGNVFISRNPRFYRIASVYQ
jgi:hypothetical protein